MGAWIEIFDETLNIQKWLSRTPRWVRGLKFLPDNLTTVPVLVAPHDGCVD